MRRQQSLGLRLKELFRNKDIKEAYFALHYRTDERRRQKELEKLGYYFIRINPNKPNFGEYEEFGRVQKYIEKSTKE